MGFLNFRCAYAAQRDEEFESVRGKYRASDSRRDVDRLHQERELDYLSCE